VIYQNHPALWIGGLLFIAVASAFGWGFSLLPWVILLIYPWIKQRNWPHLFLAFLMMTVTHAYTKTTLPIPLVTPQAHGIGYFSLSDIRRDESPFGKQIVYIGTMRYFETDQGEIAKQLPCRIYLKKTNNRPIANCHYLIEGTLTGKQQQIFVCKPDHKPWLPVSGSFSSAEWRYKAKKKAHLYLKKHFSGSRCLALFSALTLGSIEDPQLVKEFRNLGLSHILAISGFHFALSAAFLLLILRPFFSKKIASFLALLLLSYYAFFLGNSPSVLRAWVAISLFLVGYLVGLRTSGLNALGLGLIIELLFDPLLISHLGFQLSFLATAAILLLYHPCDTLLQKLFIPRPLKELESMTLVNRHFYLLSSYLRKALALNAAVHLVILPACLLHFRNFPLLSSLYNLFYPLLISLSMIALLAASIIDLLLPWLGQGFHHLNLLFTDTLLRMIANPPIVWTLYGPKELSISWIFSLWTLCLFLFFTRIDSRP